MNYSKIVKGTIITEKSTRLMERENKYVFVVDNNATKGSIKESIEALYDVKVESVNVLKDRGSLKRSWVGKKEIFRKSDIKKAIVQVESGKTLKVYEGGSK